MPDDLKLRATRFLARREHCRSELRRKLQPHAESAEKLDLLLDALEARGLLSDQRYASQRATSRGKRYGNARLQMELRANGVADEAVAEALAESGDELARGRQVWEKKFGVLPHDAETRAKQARFLQNRGFSTTTVRQIFAGNEDE